MSNPGTYVATVNVRDDFFNDPFFTLIVTVSRYRENNMKWNVLY